MTDSIIKKPLVLAISAAAFTITLSSYGTMVQAADNPFAMQELSSGYLAETEAEEGKCGEGACGSTDSDVEEGKCGEGACGDEEDVEGSCGEGACGETGEEPTEEEVSTEEEV